MDDLESWNANHGAESDKYTARYILHNSVMKKTFCLTFRVQRLRRREKEESQSVNLAAWLAIQVFQTIRPFALSIG